MFYIWLVLLAVNYWLLQRHIPFILMSGVAIVIFRADVAMLLGLFLISDLFHRRLAVTE